MTPYDIYTEKLDEISKEIMKIRLSCKHPDEFVVRTHRHNQGYDYNEYEIEHFCRYCGANWSEFQ